MYQQVYDPVSDSLGLSSIFAVLPLVALFVLLGGVKLKAWWAGLSALVVAIVVAIAVYSMPVDQALLSASEGAAFGLFPIMWIVVTALWIYNMTVATGDFAVLRRSFGAISDDQRVQAIIIAFCFGALLEALAGFGTPVAITAVMLIALGFQPMKAAAVALVANTAPVAFGAIAIPDRHARPRSPACPTGGPRRHGRSADAAAGAVRAADPHRHGRRHARHPAGAGPPPSSAAVAFAIAQFLDLELHLRPADRHRGRRCSRPASIVLLLRVWQPSEPLLGEETDEPPRRRAGPGGSRRARPRFEADRPPTRRTAANATRRARSPSPTRPTSSSS